MRVVQRGACFAQRTYALGHAIEGIFDGANRGQGLAEHFHEIAGVRRVKVAAEPVQRWLHVESVTTLHIFDDLTLHGRV